MKLIPNWKAAIGHYSTVALAAVATFGAWWSTNPDFQALVPPKVAVAVGAVVSVAGLVGKFIAQPPADGAQ